MGRGGLLLLGCSASVVVLAAGGYALTRGGGYSCADAIPDADVTERALPMHADGEGASDVIAQAAEQELADVRGRSVPLNEDEARLIEHGVEALRHPPEGWTGPTSALVDLDDPRLELVGDVVLDDSELLGENRSLGQAGRRAYVVVDAGSGALRWARDQQGQSAGGAPLGDSWLLVQAESGQRPTVAAVDPSNGRLRSCTAVGDAADVNTELSAWPVGEGVAVAAGSDSGLQLALVSAGGTEAAWEQQVEALPQVGSLAVAGDTVVMAAAGAATESRAGAARDVAGSESADPAAHAVHAVDARSGSPRWTYQTEDGGAFSHSVVGASEDVVVVAADLQTDEVVETGQVVNTRLVGLDVADGQPRWTIDVPNVANTSAADARVFGETVVTTEVSPADGGARVVELVARNAADGEELWRIPHRGTALRDADVAGDLLLLPTSAVAGNGMELIDLATGEVTPAFLGVALSRVDVDDTTVAVTADFGPVAPGALLLYEIGT